jgi:hypothetical protein
MHLTRGLLALTAGLLLAFAAGAQSADPSTFPNSPMRTGGWGDSCSDIPDGSTCISGLCVDVTPFGSVCSVYCYSNSDCGAKSNWGCYMTTQAGGQPIGICRPYRTTP